MAYSEASVSNSNRTSSSKEVTTELATSYFKLSNTKMVSGDIGGKVLQFVSNHNFSENVSTNLE